ncbi:MAG: ferrous iron transport protein A [Hyphomonadaceae bacterium]
MTLEELARGVIARVVAIDGPSEDVNAKLRELGFSEGDEVELITRGPLGGQPLAFRLNRTTIALRGPEAAAIRVAPAP